MIIPETLSPRHTWLYVPRLEWDNQHTYGIQNHWQRRLCLRGFMGWNWGEVLRFPILRLVFGGVGLVYVIMLL